MNIWSIVKIVIISTVGLVLLTYLTVDAPQKIERKQIDIKNLPQTVELIGFDDQKFATQSIVKPNSILFVGNHESIVLSNDLEKMLKLEAGKFVTISNISDAPWFIKRWQAHTKNTKLKGEKHLPWIYDRDGAMRNFLQVPTSDAVKYFVYQVNKDGIIKKIFTGRVKVGTIDGTMTPQEIEDNLKEVVSIIKNNK
ncbi:MAG: hypothetical protein U9R16_02550 [Campylobacterota bacterium]|nr:hypothetical protein [Campylobacterota bacterium]